MEKRKIPGMLENLGNKTKFLMGEKLGNILLWEPYPSYHNGLFSP